MIKAAVLGSPIAHSLSPALHNAAYKRLKIEGIYSSFEVKENELVAFISQCDSDFTGFSLTMPLKEVIFDVATKVDANAHKIHSGNTLIRQGREWFATSTDRTGFISLFNSHKLSGVKKVLIFGAGGTARAALGALDSSSVEITVVRRSNSRDNALNNCLSQAKLEIKDWQDLDLSSYELVINTVPGDATSTLLSDSSLTNAPLIDVIYNPWPTPLASRWKSAQIISGIELLIWQGIDQIELMTGAEFSREELFDYLFHTLVSLH